jgi:hypothetical protein
MNGGTYTVAAESDSPAPEYIPPANTPKAPVVTSSTHPDQGGWYKEKSAVLTWELPSDVTAVRMLLDENEGTVPTKVYDERIDEKVVDDLEEGTSFFHLQFKNAEGWGRIAHYQINVDSESPKDFKISKAESDDQNSPKKVLVFEYVDVSPIVKYNIQIDGATPLEYKDSDNSKKYTLESLSPGTHTIVVEVVDSAGNSSVGTLTFTIDAFEKPVFIEYPSRINTEVIPAIKGKTRPNATVTVSVKRAQDADIASADYDSEAGTYTAKSDALGEFIFIPDSPFAQGVYVLQATAEDAYGSVSEPSDEVRLIVEIPGYLALGTTVISVLSVVVPVVGLIVLLVFGTWYLWHRLSLWKRKVLKETREAEDMLVSEFAHLISELNLHVEKLKTARKSKLTKAEAELISQIESDIKDAEKRVSKEIEDIEKVIT